MSSALSLGKAFWLTDAREPTSGCMVSRIVVSSSNQSLNLRFYTCMPDKRGNILQWEATVGARHLWWLRQFEDSTHCLSPSEVLIGVECACVRSGGDCMRVYVSVCICSVFHKKEGSPMHMHLLFKMHLKYVLNFRKYGT